MGLRAPPPPRKAIFFPPWDGPWPFTFVFRTILEEQGLGVPQPHLIVVGTACPNTHVPPQMQSVLHLGNAVGDAIGGPPLLCIFATGGGKLWME